ncbi:2-dehydropantoate 2-reductase [Staphylococcus nepalensis]|uniref:2-dehydropantoate 2-reductase n=1 Tax=Staphylococcus nepalensis TaxID=214473 RepID=A0A380GJY9_9STAP|nr:2-dehydropantoate 2-reductase [Staphylococcus nepalensis]PNZ97494.1 2-dehydropantoate 2-reductase [Staphylococcus nepalensis]GGB76580.1 2-dehydropantoate 2-reductase [Staphylococcus nepalensis]SUM54084.1 2-dehydropantoate 2-reductase [Staphylococcus nepalensis]VDG66023.1 2-dehydropantoate 2-reductase [Lacrimispora indolis]
MRILILGAGGIGGYFGGRLVESGKNVTFLVRPKRKSYLERNGLVIHSDNGDYSFNPQLMTKEAETESFDVILLSSKSYHLDQAIEDLKPFVHEQTVIIPLLNGVAHIPKLQSIFGKNKIMGGYCIIETALNTTGEVVQTSDFDKLFFGELDGTVSDRAKLIEQSFSGSKSDFMLSSDINRGIWQKYLMITVLSSVTTMMHAPIGPIRDSKGGVDFVRSLYEEVASIIRTHKAPLDDNIVEKYMKGLTQLSYHFKTSMQRDMEKGLNIEADHLQGYLLNLAKQYQLNAPLLYASYQNHKVYKEMIQ